MVTENERKEFKRAELRRGQGMVSELPTRSLHRKLAQVLYEAERIPKNGTAPAIMGGYKFVQVGDAADYIRKALAEKVLTMMPTHVQVVGQVDRPTAKGGSITTLDLLIEWTITDGESGETTTIQSFGAGADGGDKYSGKAMTSAMKYALLSGFLLSTGEDTELGSHPDATPDKTEITTGETLRSLGPIERAGAVAKGSGRHSDLEWRQTPDGYHIGFLLEVGDGKAKPQVSVEGPLAVALFAATSGGPLLGMKVNVKGELWEITAPQRRKFYRIVASGIETDEWILPADTTSAATVPVGAANDGALPVAAQPSAGSPASVPAPTDDDLSDLPDALWAAPA